MFLMHHVSQQGLGGHSRLSVRKYTLEGLSALCLTTEPIIDRGIGVELKVTRHSLWSLRVFSVKKRVMYYCSTGAVRGLKKVMD